MRRRSAAAWFNPRTGQLLAGDVGSVAGGAAVDLGTAPTEFDNEYRERVLQLIQRKAKGEKIETHLRRRTSPQIVVSYEPERLETGGGVRHALQHFDGAPFFVVNGDALILNGPHPALCTLATVWDPERMDGLLLVHPTPEAYGYEGDGDFRMDPLGRISRRPERQLAPYIFTGVQILHPRLFEGAPEGAFSLNVLYDRAIAAERLYGVLHDGKYFHVGTPGDLGMAEAYLAYMHSGVRRT